MIAVSYHLHSHPVDTDDAPNLLHQRINRWYHLCSQSQLQYRSSDPILYSNQDTTSSIIQFTACFPLLFATIKTSNFRPFQTCHAPHALHCTCYKKDCTHARTLFKVFAAWYLETCTDWFHCPWWLVV